MNTKNKSIKKVLSANPLTQLTDAAGSLGELSWAIGKLRLEFFGDSQAANDPPEQLTGALQPGKHQSLLLQFFKGLHNSSSNPLNTCLQSLLIDKKKLAKIAQ